MTMDIMGINENDKYAAYIGIKLTKVEAGYATAQMEITKNYLNGINIVHGGAIFVLTDFTFAAAANAKGYVTLGINTNITFLKSPHGKVLITEAKEIDTQTKLCGYNVDVSDENNNLIARMGYIKR